MHTHTTMPLPSLLFFFFNQHVFNAYGLAVLGVYLPCTCLQQPGCSNTHQKQKQNKQKYTVMNALHGIHGTQRKHPLERHTHTHTGMEGQRRARLLRRRCARCTSTHARTHMQHTASGPGCEGKERRGKGGDSMGEKIKGGRGTRSAAGALALDWHHLRACAPTRCAALHRSRLQKRPRGGCCQGGGKR